MKQGETTESQVKGEIYERMTNNEKRQSPEFLEIGNVGVPEFSGNGKYRKFRSFRKSNNKQIHIPRKLTRVPGCVRIVWTDSNTIKLLSFLGDMRRPLWVADRGSEFRMIWMGLDWVWNINVSTIGSWIKGLGLWTKPSSNFHCFPTKLTANV